MRRGKGAHVRLLHYTQLLGIDALREQQKPKLPPLHSEPEACNLKSVCFTLQVGQDRLGAKLNCVLGG